MIERDAVFVDFAELRDEDIRDLKADALRTKTVFEKFVQLFLKPGDGFAFVPCRL